MTKMKFPLHRCLFVSGNASIAYFLVAATYGFTRWSDLKESGMANQIETDPKILSALTQAIGAFLAAPVLISIGLVLRWHSVEPPVQSCAPDGPTTTPKPDNRQLTPPQSR
jgi:hypothetical protein